MPRLSRFDVAGHFQRPRSRLIAKLVFGAACSLLMIATRGLFDVWFPTSGPFALVYPTVLLATLYGHWQAGMVAYCVSFFWAWYFVLPTSGSLHFEVATDPSRVTLNAASVLVVLVFAETFRRAVERARRERERELERSALLLAEMEHRTKNNFAMVASLLDIQKRRETAPQVIAAFDDAIGRVHSFAEAYSHVANQQGEGAHVDMRPYLSQLIDRIASAAFTEQVSVSPSIMTMSLPRETAVAIGLYLNEVLTNCAKYAFPDAREGEIAIDFETMDEGWKLTIRDDGLGNRSSPQHDSGGIGSRLLEAFARQADASHKLALSDGGCTAELTSLHV